MRVYKSHFKDPGTGEQRETERWYLDFTDHRQQRRRMPTDRCRTERDAERFGQYVDHLIVAVSHSERPDAKVDTWLRSLGKATLARFAKFGLIDSRYTTEAISLSRHVGDFENWLRNTVNDKNGCKRTPAYVTQVVTELRAVLSECRFHSWSDISKDKVETFIGSLRGRVTVRTCNDYIKAARSFTRWMIEEAERATEDPLRRLHYLRNAQETHRRALDAEEIAKLLNVAENGPERFGMAPHARAVLYYLAIETGYRTRELRSLKVADFDFAERSPEPFRTPAVRLAGEFTKNRQKAEQALRRDDARRLQTYFAGRAADEPAFALPDGTLVTRMMRADLKVAGIAAKDSAGNVVCFHSLRHTLATLLDRSGVSLKTRMGVMRHSDRGNITLGVYTDDVTLLEKRDAVEKLPALPWPGEIQQIERKEEVA